MFFVSLPAEIKIYVYECREVEKNNIIVEPFKTADAYGLRKKYKKDIRTY